MDKQHLIKLIQHDLTHSGEAKVTERMLAETFPEKITTSGKVLRSSSDLERVIFSFALQYDFLYTRDADAYTFIKASAN